MHIRAYVEHDLPQLIQLTIDTFGPFYEQHFRPLVGDTVFAHQHGDWREDYRAQVPTLHDPSAHKYVAVAEKTTNSPGTWRGTSTRRADTARSRSSPSHEDTAVSGSDPRCAGTRSRK